MNSLSTLIMACGKACIIRDRGDAPVEHGSPHRNPRRTFLALGALAALAPIGLAGCGASSDNEAEILKGPPGKPSTIPSEDECGCC